jgi:NADPH-dependent ferric siderophore reductase
VERLSPHFLRIHFRGEQLTHFGRAGLDQRIKLVLPHLDGSISDVGQHSPGDPAGDWHARWRALDDARRNPFRTYTIRRFDPAAAQVTVDFALHTDPGPAGAWAAAATPGQEVLIIGPDERSPDSRIGLDWHPGSASDVLLAGDETAAPAICSILESLPLHVRARAFIEVPAAADRLPIAGNGLTTVTWIARDDAAHGQRLYDAVERWTTDAGHILAAARGDVSIPPPDVDVDRELLWDSPDDGPGAFYAWIAGEAAMVKRLRSMLVADLGIDRSRVAFMGYWRRGLSERQG